MFLKYEVIVLVTLFMCFCLFIPHQAIVAGYYGFKTDVRVSVRSSVRPSVFRFRMITSKHQWIFTKLGMYIDIVKIWLGLLMGKFR